ncbi:MAG TPA: nucleoside deaminase [Thermoanaerobaculia bacterium]|nr:nucleoside deaminase [Thermoanaerobaculia bacterium]
MTAAQERFLRQAVDLALEAERAGNLPVAAVIARDGEVVSAAAARTLRPAAHPGRHAEVLALAGVPDSLVPRLGEMTCYCTLEPCLMCFGALVLHGVGAVVFGARDPRGGALALLPHLPPQVAARARAIRWSGPAWPEVCDPIARRVLARYWAAGG